MRTPRTWKHCRVAEAGRLFEDVLLEATKLGYENCCDHNLSVFQSPTKFGICISYPNGKNSYFSVIGVNESILSDQQLLLSTLIHEVAHSLYPKDHHGQKWRTAGNRIGNRFGVDISTTFDNSVHPLPSKYVIQCPRCNKTWGFQRLCQTVKFPELYHCKDCLENLVRIK